MLRTALITTILMAISTPLGIATEQQIRTDRAIRSGLKWLAKEQQKNGCWRGSQERRYQVSLTSLAGMAFLMEGSTVRAGRYSKNIRAAVRWLISQSHRGAHDGLIHAKPAWPNPSRYYFGHGYALLFLASTYGEEESPYWRKRLRDVLTRAVKFSVRGQTRHGGWGYVLPSEQADFDEVATTLCQLQGLRAAAQAGISVPEQVVKNARQYLQACTSMTGVIYYGLYRTHARPGLALASIHCAFPPTMYQSPLVKQWLQDGKKGIISLAEKTASTSLFLRYYLTQTVFSLGDTSAAKLDPALKGIRGLQWSHYKSELFSKLVRNQNQDGSWSGGLLASVYATSLHLSLLQLDRKALPLYQIRRQN